MELGIILAVQSVANPVLDALFLALTMLGEEAFILLVYAWLYWNYDKEKGLYVGYAALTSVTLNGVVKEVFRAPRPIGEPGVRSLRVETATGHSFPSGHSQASATLGTALALSLKKRWVRVLGFGLPPLVALSRIYLGVHWPKDVAVGLLLGAGVAAVCHLLIRTLRSRNLLFLTTWLLMLPFAAVAQSADYYKALATFGGLVAGAAFEEYFVGFSTRTTRRRRWLRYLFGIGLLVAVKEGLGLLLPGGTIFLCIRYFTVSLVGIGLYPWLFHRLRL